jgi:hypothetical protein
MPSPTMIQLEVHPHRSGPWLVEAGGGRYAVPARIGEILLPLAGYPVGCDEVTTLLSEKMGEDGAHLAARLTAPKTRFRGRPIWGRVRVLNPKKTMQLSSGLSAWASWRWLLVSTLLGLMGYAFGFRLGPLVSGGMGPWAWTLAFGLFLGSAMWHELGHAAALQREGYPPGGIGFGVLFVVPVLFADVTAMAALPRAGRLRVDVAGVCFQLGAGGILAGLAPWAGWAGPSMRLASLAALGAVFWSLIPFMRSDGYWLLGDTLGLADLDTAPPASTPLPVRWFVALFRLMNALFMVAVVVLIPLRVHRLLTGLALRGGLDPDHPLIRVSALAAAVFLLAGMGLAAARRLRRLALS